MSNFASANQQWSLSKKISIFFGLFFVFVSIPQFGFADTNPDGEAKKVSPLKDEINKQTQAFGGKTGAGYGDVALMYDTRLMVAEIIKICNAVRSQNQYQANHRPHDYLVRAFYIFLIALRGYKFMAGMYHKNHKNYTISAKHGIYDGTTEYAKLRSFLPFYFQT